MLTGSIFHSQLKAIILGISIILSGCNAGSNTPSTNGTLSLQAPSTLIIKNGTATVTAGLSGISANTNVTTQIVNLSISNTAIATLNGSYCTITIPSKATSGTCSLQLTGKSPGTTNITAHLANGTQSRSQQLTVKLL